jgi:hypothetical protein
VFGNRSYTNTNLVCSRVSHYVAKNLMSRQKNWAMAMQERIAAISCLLKLYENSQSPGAIRSDSKTGRGFKDSGTESCERNSLDDGSLYR